MERANSADRRTSIGHLPPRHDGTVFRIVIGWDSDRNDLLFRRVEQAELVKVVVQPAHGILDGNVQVPERVLLGHLDAPPDERFRP